MYAVVAILLIGGCYNPPTPVCGFLCGPNSACPAGYTCNATDAYCHLDGAADVSCTPEPPVDAFDFFPRIAESVPAEGALDVALDVIATVKFTEQVMGISEQTFTLAPQDAPFAPVVGVVAYNSTTRTATFDAVGLLAPSKTYVATLGEIADLSGQRLVGATSWTFETMADVTPPTVTTEPTPGAVGVAVDGTLVATFSEIVLNANSINFQLADPLGNIPGTIGFVAETAVRLTPSRQLTPNTLHTATLTTAITDLAGNPLVGAPVVWTFTTGSDVLPPTVLSKIPDDGDFDVTINATPLVTFSEDVVGVSQATMTLQDASGPVAATVSYDTVARLARLTPVAPLAPATTYTMNLSSMITDGSLNALVPVQWTFTTAP